MMDTMGYETAAPAPLELEAHEEEALFAKGMLGAIVGDVVGSVYEWNNYRATDFEPLISPRAFFTDDSVMTVAVAGALLETQGGAARAALGPACTKWMRRLGRRYPDAGYGGRFAGWLSDREPAPYNSWGNGSAMRVSPAGWVANSVERSELLAAETALVTHNHPEGVKGAQATAACIFLARSGYENLLIREYVEREFGYDLGFTLDEIRDSYRFNESCQGTVPQAIVAFLESRDFEDAIRLAISVGGDSDTLAAITGSIAQARYGIPREIVDETRKRLDADLLGVLDLFCATFM